MYTCLEHVYYTCICYPCVTLVFFTHAIHLKHHTYITDAGQLGMNVWIINYLKSSSFQHLKKKTVLFSLSSTHLHLEHNIMLYVSQFVLVNFFAFCKINFLKFFFWCFLLIMQHFCFSNYFFLSEYQMVKYLISILIISHTCSFPIYFGHVPYYCM